MLAIDASLIPTKAQRFLSNVRLLLRYELGWPKTSSLRIGLSRREASTSNCRLGFAIHRPQPFYQFSFSYLALARAAIADGICESQQLVESWIA